MYAIFIRTQVVLSTRNAVKRSKKGQNTLIFKYFYVSSARWYMWFWIMLNITVCCSMKYFNGLKDWLFELNSSRFKFILNVLYHWSTIKAFICIQFYVFNMICDCLGNRELVTKIYPNLGNRRPMLYQKSRFVKAELVTNQRSFLASKSSHLAFACCEFWLLCISHEVLLCLMHTIFLIQSIQSRKRKEEKVHQII